MNELPASALQPKHAGRTDSQRHDFLSTSDPTSTAFHLDDAGKIVGEVLGYEFDFGDLSVAVVRGGAGKCRLNLLATAYVRPEGIPKVTSSASEYNAWKTFGSPFSIALRAAWLSSIALARSFVAI